MSRLLAFAAVFAATALLGSAQEQICNLPTQNTCNAIAGCTWCSSAAVPSKCYSAENASKLPAAVFKCDAHDEPSPSYSRTPSGWVLSHCVHKVQPGVHLVRQPEGGHKVFDGVDGSYLHTIPLCSRPYGWWPVVVPASVGDPIQHVEKHAAFYLQQMKLKQGQVESQSSSDTSSSSSPSSSSSSSSSRQLLQLPPDYDGWLAYTELMDAEGYDQFLGYFSVPVAPKYTPDILYFFTGVQNIDWIPKTDPMPTGPFDIIQPVLQTPADSGDDWSVKSWLVTLDEGAIQTNEIVVQAGQKIWGNMTHLGGASWYCGSFVDSPQGQVTDFTKTDATRLSSQPWAYTTLECYGCYTCDNFPTNACEFTEMQIFKGNQQVRPLLWNITPKKPVKTYCNETVITTSIDGKIVDGSAVTYYFQNAN